MFHVKHSKNININNSPQHINTPLAPPVHLVPLVYLVILVNLVPLVYLVNLVYLAPPKKNTPHLIKTTIPVCVFLVLGEFVIL